MRFTRKSLIPGLAALVGSFGMAVLPAGSAHADSTTSLPLKSFAQMVVDSVHQRIFLSQGSDSQNTVLVTDFSGRTVGTVDGQNGLMSLALSADDSTLYATLRGDHAVSAIDTASLQETARYPLGNTKDPAGVAVQSGKVWVAYYDNSTNSGGIGDIDPAAAAPAFAPQDVFGRWSGSTMLSADPSGGGELVAADNSTAASYDVSTQPVTVRAQPKNLSTCENQQDLAVAPGGSEFVLACGAPYEHYRYRTSDLSTAGAYPSTNYPNAVAFDAEGDVAAGVSGWYNTDVYIYRADSSDVLNTYEFGGPQLNLASRGLAWSGNGGKLFAVLQDIDSGALSLRVLDTPVLTVGRVTLGGTSSTAIGKSVTLTGTLSPGARPLPAHTRITVVRSMAGSTATTTLLTWTAPNGTFRLTDTPTALGTYVYKASYAGDASHAPSSAGHTVTITRIPTALSVTTNASTYVYNGTAKVTAHLGATSNGRTVSVYAQPYGSTAKKLLRTGTVDSHGNLTVAYTLTRNTTFSVAFAGDARYAPAAASHVGYTQARVSTAVSGYYTSASYGGITYRVYHHTHALDVAVGVTPNKKGQCVQFEVQSLYQGHWYSSVTTGCGTLNSASSLTGTLNLSKAAGARYRIRAHFVHSTTDNTNLSTYGSWLYFSVVS